MKLVPVDFTGGVNLLRDRRYVAPNELTYAKNFVPTKSGLAGKRLPRGLVPGTNGLPVGLGWAHTLGLYITDVPGADFAAAYRTVVGSQIAGIQAFTYAGGSALAGATYNVLPTRRPQAVNFDRKLYVVAGAETHSNIVIGSTVATSGVILQVGLLGSVEFTSLTFNTTQAIPVGPRLLASYRRRMVYADFGPGMEDWVVFSDWQAPLTISQDALVTNGRNFRLGGTPGRITALREVMLTAAGTPTETALVAFKEQSMYIIQGEPGQTQDTEPYPATGPNTILGTLVVQRVNTNAGCSSPETIVQTPYGLLWAGPDDVWLLSGGQVPVRVGTKIRPILEATPADKRHLWHASYFNGFYRLSLFSEGQGPGEDSPCGEQWWLDLRETDEDGQPNMKWWGPMVYKAVPGQAVGTAWDSFTSYVIGNVRSHNGNTYIVTTGGVSDVTGPSGYGTGIVDGTVIWDWQSTTTELTGVRMQALDTRDGRAPQLLSLESNNIGQSYLHSYDTGGASGRDGPATNGFSGSILPVTLDDSEIDVELRTAEMDEGDPGTEKVYAGTELSIASSEATYISAETHYDGGARVTTDSETFGQTGFVEDVASLDSALFTREFKAQTIRPSPSTRPRGKTIQQTIRDTPGYIIDETCDTLGFYVEGTLPTFNFSFTVTLTHGLYATISDLISELQTKFVAAFLANRPIGSLDVFLLSNQYPAPRSSAVPTLVIDPNASFTLTGWIIWWSTALSGPLVMDPVKAKLVAMLGFDTSLQDPISGNYYQTVSLTDTFTAVTPVYNKRSAHFELNNIFHDLIPMPRRPL